MEPLAVVTRSGYIESIHYGLICVSDEEGRIIYHKGDPETLIFFRSSAKPFQVLPLIRSGAAAAFGLTSEEIAVACASHSGQDIHQETVAKFLEKLGFSVQDLHCGVMEPYNEAVRKQLLARNEQPNQLHCSCSGKHAAMLALAKYRKWPAESYYHPGHPVQKEITHTIAYFSAVDPEDILTGVDGCGAPVYLLPASKIAPAYARLMECAENTNSIYHQACKTVTEAMMLHPELVAGEGEFCTELMRTLRPRLVAKVGSEAVYCVGISGKRLGVCIKISDGNERAVYPVVLRILDMLGLIGAGELDELREWRNPAVINNLGEETGRVWPAFAFDGNITVKIGEKFLQP